MQTSFAWHVAKVIVLCLWATRPLLASTTVTLPDQVQRLGPKVKPNKTLPTLPTVIPHVKINITEGQPNCIQIQCKFICFMGKSDKIAKDIDQAASVNEITCPVFEEVRLYNYEFVNNTILPGFLGAYINKVQALYIASSNVSNIEAGAFGGGVFQQIFLEDLQLHALEKQFFEGISSDFYELSIIQKSLPVQSICATFLNHVKYQIKSFTLQVGTKCIRNITAAGNLLNNLAFVDFSYNDFEAGFSVDTFGKLSMVEHLDLSHSKISYLPDYIFCEFTATLQYLNLSYNQLMTISKMIFGWREVPSLLKIEAGKNPWNCSCALSEQMKEIFVYQSPKLFCATPEKSQEWSVFDERLCEEDYGTNEVTSTTMTSIKYTTSMLPLTSCLNCGIGFPPFPATSAATTTVDSTTVTSLPEDTVLVQCVSPTNKSEFTWHTIEWPPLQFQLTSEPKLRVNVTIETDDLNESYGLLWFSRVTSESYKMEINYNEYGLGCYAPVAHTTTVENLMPDTAYTFCLVLKDQLTISPFSCESIYVGGNVEVTAWLTRNMRAKGISLVVLGVVGFSFSGICMVFLLLKRKPILLKGSKRIATTGSNSMDIVVFPKETILENFKLKEQMLAKRSSGSINTPIARRGSVESIESNQSYMNANLYEVIPAYLKLQDLDLNYEKLPPCPPPEPNDNYLPPLASTNDGDNLVIYAEVPHRTKRISSDPLPEVPRNESQAYLSLQLHSCHEEDTSSKAAVTMDSPV